MALMYDKVVAQSGNILLPIMITCDPARDNPAVLKEYLKEFHPHFIGLTGDYDKIKDVCKKYRVYFSTPQNVKEGQDYLVDHSIYFYLMGTFVSCGRRWWGVGADIFAQTQKATLSRPLGGTLRQIRLPRSSTTTSRTGRSRSRRRRGGTKVDVEHQVFLSTFQGRLWERGSQ